MSRKQSSEKHMNTDEGIVTEYIDIMTPEKRSRITALLSSNDTIAVNNFIEAIRDPASALQAYLYAHADIPTAKEQERFLTKLNSKTKRLNKLTCEISEMLDGAPIGLKRRAREAKIPIHVVQTNMISMMMVINDITPQKSKYRPEIGLAVVAIAEAFNNELKIKPKVRAFREDDDVPLDLPVGDQFVPVLAEVINRGVDRAYRLARKFLPS